MELDANIYVAGHNGMVGSAILRRLKKLGYKNIITAPRKLLDLTQQQAVQDFFAKMVIDYVFLAAAKVGGIHANDIYSGDFIRENLLIQTHVIHEAYSRGVKKLLFLGSSCIYPKHAPQPMAEKALLTGPLEPTNEAYAIAKIAGLKMCQAYRKQYGFNAISAMPCNLYGPGDNYHPQNSHVVPALIRKFHEAKEAKKSQVTVWGTGQARREFLHVDDAADASVFLMQHYDDAIPINVGMGQDISILELAQCLKKIIDYSGELIFDKTKPDGTLQKKLDTTKINQLGWQATIGLSKGLIASYQWFLQHHGVRESINENCISSQ